MLWGAELFVFFKLNMGKYKIFIVYCFQERGTKNVGKFKGNVIKVSNFFTVRLDLNVQRKSFNFYEKLCYKKKD